MDLLPKINCRIKVQSGDIMVWTSGYIKSKNADGTVWVIVPSADQLYLCNPEEVFVNLENVREFMLFHKL